MPLYARGLFVVESSWQPLQVLNSYCFWTVVSKLTTVVLSGWSSAGLFIRILSFKINSTPASPSRSLKTTSSVGTQGIFGWKVCSPPKYW